MVLRCDATTPEALTTIEPNISCCECVDLSNISCCECGDLSLVKNDAGKDNDWSEERGANDKTVTAGQTGVEDQNGIATETASIPLNLLSKQSSGAGKNDPKNGSEDAMEIVFSASAAQNCANSGNMPTIMYRCADGEIRCAKHLAMYNPTQIFETARVYSICNAQGDHTYIEMPSDLMKEACRHACTIHVQCQPPGNCPNWFENECQDTHVCYTRIMSRDKLKPGDHVVWELNCLTMGFYQHGIVKDPKPEGTSKYQVGLQTLWPTDTSAQTLRPIWRHFGPLDTSAQTFRPKHFPIAYYFKKITG